MNMSLGKNGISGKAAILLTSAVLALAVVVAVWWLWFKTPPPPAVKPLATVGVGLYMGRQQDGKFHVTRIFPNSPAEKAGLVPGVILNKVDGTLAEKKNIKELSKLLTGPVGSKVMVELIDESGNTNTVEIVREMFINHSTR